jgi:peptide-methionine (S)-S-oxide reductase
MAKTSMVLLVVALTRIFMGGCAETKEHNKMNSNNEQKAELEDAKQIERTNNYQKATFAAGCFWGVEAAFRKVPGVVSTVVGYTGGHKENPTYRQVCSGRTGHAEAVQVRYDPTKVSYEQLLEVFWRIHNPTTLNRQGPDVGSQYRSAIFYHNDRQQSAAEASKKRLEQSGKFNQPIVTEIVPAGKFYRAEEYHQRYFEKHGGAACHLP